MVKMMPKGREINYDVILEGLVRGIEGRLEQRTKIQECGRVNGLFHFYATNQ